MLYLMEHLQYRSIVFQQIGGVHNAALCGESEIIVVKSDIERHNALDKLYRYCMIQQTKIVAFSGRVSSKVWLKVPKIVVGILLFKAHSNPVVGRLEHNSCRLDPPYTHPDCV